jgi:hypothetical protein
MRNISEKNCRENRNILFYSIILLQNSCRLADGVQKCSGAKQATDCNIKQHRKDEIRILDK